MIKKIIIWFIAVIHGSKNADQYLNKITIMILWYDMGGEPYFNIYCYFEGYTCNFKSGIGG